MGDFGGDERAVSESVGVAILIGMTILVTATVGLNVVLFSDDANADATANFSYDHVEPSNALVITHVDGPEYPASEVVIEGNTGETTWAESANVEPSEPVGPGDITQISEGNSFGEPVTQQSTIRIYHEVDGNRTQVDEWP